MKKRGISLIIVVIIIVSAVIIALGDNNVLDSARKARFMSDLSA